jgi:hypothetical protein
MIIEETDIEKRTKPANLPNKQGNKLFPIFLKLENLNTLIIGGGSVGYEKLSALLNNSPEANVTLLAPLIRGKIFSLAKQHPNVELINKTFDIEDLENKDIVISATNDKKLNSFIREEAKRKGILVNVTDTPELCDFYLSAIVQKGSIKLAISTNGKSPTIAKRLREIFSDAIPDEMENVLDNLVKIRSRFNGNFSEKVKTLNSITSVLVEDRTVVTNEPKRKLKLKQYVLIAFTILLIMIAGHLIFQNIIP